MSHIVLRFPIRLLGATTLFLLLLAPAMPATAAGHTDGGTATCTEESTPNLIVTATNAGKDGPRLTLTVQTDRFQTEGYVNGNWNVVFRANVDGTEYVLDRWDIHKVFLVDHETKGAVAAMQEDDCSGGEGETCEGGGGTGDTGGCDDEEGECGGSGQESGTTVAIRGQGYFNGDSKPVPFQMNLTDGGNDRTAPDVVKVRWQAPKGEDQVHTEADSCEGGGWVDGGPGGWHTLENAQHVNIQQLTR